MVVMKKRSLLEGIAVAVLVLAVLVACVFVYPTGRKVKADKQQPTLTEVSFEPITTMPPQTEPTLSPIPTPVETEVEEPIIEIEQEEVEAEIEEQDPEETEHVQVVEQKIVQEVDTDTLEKDRKKYIDRVVEEKVAAAKDDMQKQLQKKIDKILKDKDYASKDDLLELADMKDIQAVYEYVDEQDESNLQVLSDSIENLTEPADTLDD